MVGRETGRLSVRPPVVKPEYAYFNVDGDERTMAKVTRLGDLERAVMDHLWSTPEPQTVRQVHEALSARRDLAYTTVMTVLQRLAKKNLVSQIRDDRAHRYAPVQARDELVAGLMVDALSQAADPEAGRPRWCTLSSVSVLMRPRRCGVRSPNWKQINAIRHEWR